MMSKKELISNNPLLDFSDLPRFADIQAQHIVPAIDYLIEEAAQAVEKVTSSPDLNTWHDITKTLDTTTERLGRAWGAIGHLKAVKDSPELRDAVNAEIPKITAFWTQLGQDERLYAKYKAIKNSNEYANLNAAQKRALELSLRSFVLSGAELQGKDKERFAQIQEEMAVLMQRFSENVLDATDEWELYATDDELKGVPSDIMSAMKAAAQSKEKTGYRLSLQPPIYIPIMQYVENAALRETLYKAYVTRASEFNSDEKNNTPIIDQIIALRQEEAQLIGYANFAEVSLVPKMASSPQQVVSFLRELAAKALPYAKKDWQELQTYAKEHLGMSTMNAWDAAYVSEKLKEQRYAFSDQEVKAYFPQDRAVNGLFKIIEQLFEVQIKPDLSPAAKQTWDPHVTLYRVERNGTLLGQLYTDLTAREGKRAGAWMDDVRARWMRPDNQHLQTPVAQLVCNFAQGVDGKQPLLTHDDVITLFHESGHVFHHLLTQVTELDVSGISGVEWDAVELPSQFMENFCWDWAVLQQISSHTDTQEPLPRVLFDKMIAAKNYQSGMQTVRQIEFSLFDMLLHSEYDPAKQTVQSLLEGVRKEVSVSTPPDYNRFQCSFSHIFAGGYSAGYYSYKWAEVLSADAFAAFEEKRKDPNQTILDPETGRKFRQEVLEVGGSRPAMESFVAFRGREPELDALLRHQGMSDTASMIK